MVDVMVLETLVVIRSKDESFDQMMASAGFTGILSGKYIDFVRKLDLKSRELQQLENALLKVMVFDHGESARWAQRLMTALAVAHLKVGSGARVAV